MVEGPKPGTCKSPKAPGSLSYQLVITKTLLGKINRNQTEAAAGRRTKRADEHRDSEQENAEGKILISIWNDCPVDTKQN